MPYDFHKDHAYYLAFLAENTRKSIIPFIVPHLAVPLSDARVLELGCGEGGNLRPFGEAGAHCTGIDLNAVKIEAGRELMADLVKTGRMELFAEDIFNADIERQFTGRYDLIILKDVIEHIPNKDKALLQMHKFLKEDGLLFIGWPPWRMPFGGHQQIAASGLLKKLPWFHLLPKSLYVGVLRMFNEPKEVVEELAEIHDYRVSISLMNKLYKLCGFEIRAERHYLVNPIYEHKFGLKTREQWPIIRRTPWFRDFLTSSCYYLLGKQKG
ncbi:MAG: class I SAM-dependent methyltransferase [Bacteroidia bacterium]